jgi:hypothetical protein
MVGNSEEINKFYKFSEVDLPRAVPVNLSMRLDDRLNCIHGSRAIVDDKRLTIINREN